MKKAKLQPGVEVVYFLVSAPKAGGAEEIVAGPFDDMTSLVDAVEQAEEGLGENNDNYGPFRAVKGLRLAPEVHHEHVIMSTELRAMHGIKSNSKVVKLHGSGK